MSSDYVKGLGIWAGFMRAHGKDTSYKLLYMAVYMQVYKRVKGAPHEQHIKKGFA